MNTYSFSNSEDIGSMTIGDFKLWSNTALTTFLSLRKKPVTGSTETLVAR